MNWSVTFDVFFGEIANEAAVVNVNGGPLGPTIMTAAGASH